MTDGGRVNYKLLIVLPCAGLVAGMVTADVSYPALQSDVALLLLSATFGFFVALCFGVFRIMRSARSIITFVAGSILACFVAFAAATITELLSQFGSGAVYSILNRSRPPEPIVYSTALFVGGTAGAFGLLIALFYTVLPEWRRRGGVAIAFYWSLVGGALAVVGWKLGPFLGMALWSGLHARGLTPPTETALNAAGQPSRDLSLYVLWQAGMALVLGLALQTYAASRQAKVTS